MTANPLFGVVAPGRPAIFDFQPVNETKAITVLQDPSSITEVTFFLLAGNVIPDGFGAMLYYSIPPFTNWETLGAISPSKPSGIFRTGWSTKEELIGCPIVQLGVALEQ